MKLAIFDFDGSITSMDSFENFILFRNGGIKTLRGLLNEIPALLGYLLGSLVRTAIFSKQIHTLVC